MPDKVDHEVAFELMERIKSARNLTLITIDDEGRVQLHALGTPLEVLGMNHFVTIHYWKEMKERKGG